MKCPSCNAERLVLKKVVLAACVNCGDEHEVATVSDVKPKRVTVNDIEALEK